jgi:molecular chaperone GrpE
MASERDREAVGPGDGSPRAEGATTPETAAESASHGFKVNDRRFWATGDEGGQPEEAEAQRSEYPTYVEQLRGELADKDKTLREYIAAYKQEVLHGLEETKQRLQREAERELAARRAELVEPLLEVLDNLERCLEASGEAASVAGLRQGVAGVRDLFLAKLQPLGLTAIEADGLPFDPQRHEAVAVLEVTDPARHNLVVRVLRRGYLLGDRLLRPALVQVGRKG